MKMWLLSLMTVLGISSAAYADNAVGVVLGDPTGFSGRFSLDDSHSLETALAYSSGYFEGLHFHATYMWDKARAFKTQADPLYLYYGLGLRVISINRGKYDGDVAIAPRAPLGLLYNLENPDIEIFGELSMALDLTPRTDADIDAGVGVRVRF